MTLRQRPKKSARIAVGNGEYAEVDLEDLPLVALYKWHSQKGTKTRYAITRHHPDHNPCYMHRLIMGFPEEIIDHEDRDGLNNRKTNLKLSNKSLNGFNTGLRVDNVSGVTGVHPRKRKGHKDDYHVILHKDGKRISIGYRQDFKKAVILRRDAELKYWGTTKITDEFIKDL